MQVQVCVPDPVHADHPPVVVAVERRQPGDGGESCEEDDEQHRDRDGDEDGAEVVGLRDQRQRDHAAREDGQEDGDPAEQLAVGQGPGREQAPVLGGQYLHLGGSVRVRPRGRFLSRHFLSHRSLLRP